MPRHPEPQLTEQQRRAVAWLAAPPGLRPPGAPDTLQELADALGTSRWTLQRWRRDSRFQQAVLEANRRLLADQLPAVAGALVESALLPGSAGASDRRLFAEWFGDFQPARRVQTEISTRRTVIGGRASADDGDLDETCEQLFQALLERVSPERRAIIERAIAEAENSQ